MPSIQEFVKICCVFTMFVGALVLAGNGYWGWGWIVVSITPTAALIVRWRKKRRTAKDTKYVMEAIFGKGGTRS